MSQFSLETGFLREQQKKIFYTYSGPNQMENKLKDDKGSFINIFKNLRHFHNQSRTNDEFQNSCFANCGEMNPWFLLLNYLKYCITFDYIGTFKRPNWKTFDLQSSQFLLFGKHDLILSEKLKIQLFGYSYYCQKKLEF